MEEEFIEIPEGHIRNFVQDWLNETKLGKESGTVHLSDIQWKETEQRFKETFEQNWKREYIVTAQKLFDFINDIIYRLVNRVFEEMLESGEYDLAWNKEGEDFCLMPKEQTDGDLPNE